MLDNWIDVLTHGSLEQVGRLRDNRHRRAQFVKSYLGDVDTVNKDSSLCRLEYAKQREEQL